MKILWVFATQVQEGPKMALQLPSRKAVRMALSAEKELFNMLQGVVERVRDSGGWRSLSNDPNERNAVESWLTSAWYDGFIDDEELVTAWLSALPEDGSEPSSELRDAVEKEKSVVEGLLKTVENEAAKLEGLPKRTLQSWLKDLGDEINGKEEFLKYF